MTRRDMATERQVQAADPRGSVWLSANAGSGKTRVLTDRVARLLLQDVSPQHILCLTYTKAAASEMQNRLFQRLGEWAMHDAGKLREDLRKLGVEGTIDGSMIARARRLFARAIETPGGLKIQTIHSFCAALLRRFPLEAGISPQFAEMDERAAKLLREEIVEDIADGPRGEVIDTLARHLSGDDLAALTGEIVKHGPDFAASGKGRAAIFAAFGLEEGAGPDDATGIAFDGSEPDLLSRLLPICRDLPKTYADFADALAALDLATPGRAELEALYGLFLYKSGENEGRAKSANFPQSRHRKAVEALGPVLPELHAFMDRVEAARMFESSLYSARKSLALREFASAFLSEYEARKAARGWLDFDDLILKARALLTDPGVAQWVLFRLDGGIDHILVDEAQDTSPAQWQVIERLAQEFTAGEGARPEADRSIFVVGDKKQSIYSFQGADPEGFDRMRAHFGGRLEEAGRPFAAMELLHSFRSSEAVLRLVDHAFARRNANGLGGATRHIAFKSAMPGRVDLWPSVPKTEEAEPGDWHDPVDRVAENHHSVILANQVAGQIAAMVGKAVIPKEVGQSGTFTMRPVREGDFLILVQRRSALFHELIRACKAHGLAIAGADRLKIGGELAVKDITALLSFLATAEDDLSLASALRSPLCGWSQRALHALARARGEKAFLWRALRDREDEFPETVAMLRDLRDNADFLRPYDLIERVLTRHGGRRRLLARLGAEAEDGIDALLSQALAYERNDVPSLTGFLAWLASEEVTIKRQLDSAGDRIRVMTVHGAKGLESPIVILPDTAKPDNRVRDEIYRTPAGPMWKSAGPPRPDLLQSAHDDLAARLQAERDRLLYVAMTRAEKWLIVTGCGEMGKDGEAWYETVARGMEHAGATKFAFPHGEGLRLEVGDWTGTAEEGKRDTGAGPPAAPGWTETAAPPPEGGQQTLAPSGLGGAKALPGEDGRDEEAALAHGRRLHLLLEHLPAHPRGDWAEVGGRLIRSGEDPATGDEADRALDEAMGVLEAEGLSFLFGPEALAEVEVSATLPQLGGARIHGAIDRLVVSKTRVLAVDFKSNAAVPGRPEDIPDGILRQLGAYHAALLELYPGREVETAVLWTRTATLMPVAQDAVIGALARAGQP